MRFLLILQGWPLWTRQKGLTCSHQTRASLTSGNDTGTEGNGIQKYDQITRQWFRKPIKRVKPFFKVSSNLSRLLFKHRVNSQDIGQVLNLQSTFKM